MYYLWVTLSPLWAKYLKSQPQNVRCDREQTYLSDFTSVHCRWSHLFRACTQEQKNSTGHLMDLWVCHVKKPYSSFFFFWVAEHPLKKPTDTQRNNDVTRQVVNGVTRPCWGCILYSSWAGKHCSELFYRRPLDNFSHGWHSVLSLITLVIFHLVQLYLGDCC